MSIIIVVNPTYIDIYVIVHLIFIYNVLCIYICVYVCIYYRELQPKGDGSSSGLGGMGGLVGSGLGRNLSSQFLRGDYGSKGGI